MKGVGMPPTQCARGLGVTGKKRESPLCVTSCSASSSEDFSARQLPGEPAIAFLSLFFPPLRSSEHCPGSGAGSLSS